MDKNISEFVKSLKAVEGFVGATVVEDKGVQHVVLATSQSPARLHDLTAPSSNAIELFAQRFGLRVSVVPFVERRVRAICYDIAVRN